MINQFEKNNVFVFEITEPSGIEDAVILQTHLKDLFATNKVGNIKLSISTPLHISLCTLMYTGSIEASKNEGKLSITDSENIVETTFNDLGLEKEFNEVINNLKD